MHYSFAATALLAGASAFPFIDGSVKHSSDALLQERELEEKWGYSNFEEYSALQRKRGLEVGKNQDNCGFFPCDTFNEDQFVETRAGSKHEWRKPGAKDIRGPCPGLNSAANHGYVDRSGVVDFEGTVEGLFAAFGMSRNAGEILGVFSIFNSGSLIDLKWSIGGPMKSPTFGLLGDGNGYSNSHNKYEGDGSPTRGDAYLHNGDAHSVNIPNFKVLYDMAEGGEFTLNTLRKHNVYAHEFSKNNNPYAFFGGTFAVPSFAHQFTVTLMSNHSAEKPGGTLTKSTLKSFMSVKEHKDGSLEWIRGGERIPDNYYRRPTNNPYGPIASIGDLAITCSQHPQICEMGGNIGKPNSFVGLDAEDVTGGVFKSSELLKGNNLGCIFIEGLTFAVPNGADKIFNGVGKASRLAQGILGAQKNKLGCPQLTQYDTKKFNRYPGFTWDQPLQPARPY